MFFYRAEQIWYNLSMSDNCKISVLNYVMLLKFIWCVCFPLQECSKEYELINFYRRDLLKIRLQQYYSFFCLAKFYYTMWSNYTKNKFIWKAAPEDLDMLRSVNGYCLKAFSIVLGVFSWINVLNRTWYVKKSIYIYHVQSYTEEFEFITVYER